MVLLALKEGTAAGHRALEERLALPRRLATPSAVRATLARFYGFYAPLEARLAGRDDWGLIPLDFARRQKAPLLERDLRALGLTDDGIGSLPRCAALPRHDPLPRALGCLYVLEGATLGGQLIARHLGHALGLDAETGAAFFRSYGPEVGAMWRSFGAAVAGWMPDRAAEALMVAAARETFAAFDAWLGGPYDARAGDAGGEPGR